MWITLLAVKICSTLACWTISLNIGRTLHAFIVSHRISSDGFAGACKGKLLPPMMPCCCCWFSSPLAATSFPLALFIIIIVKKILLHLLLLFLLYFLLWMLIGRRENMRGKEKSFRSGGGLRSYCGGWEDFRLKKKEGCHLSQWTIEI